MAEVSDRDMPLFVRVEGYKDVLKDLEAIRQILENMDESVQVLRKVQEVKEKSIKNFLENVDRLDEKLDNVNVELPELNEDMGRPGIRTDSRDSARAEGSAERRNSVERSFSEEQVMPESRVPKRKNATNTGEGSSRRRDVSEDEEAVEGSINDLHSELKGLKDQLNNL